MPHKEKVLSEAQCTFLEEHSTPCHARAAGVKNPLTMRMIETTPAVEQLLADTILEQVDSVQKKLCALDCHVSRKEIHNYRQPRLEKLKKVAAAMQQSAPCYIGAESDHGRDADAADLGLGSDAPLIRDGAHAESEGSYGGGVSGGNSAGSGSKMVATLSAVKRTLFSRVQGWLSSKQEPLQEPDGPPPPDAPPGPPGDMPDLSDSQEEAVAIALSLEGCGGSAEDVARENVARLQEFGCTSPKRGQGAGSSTDAPTPKTARTTPATGRMSSRTRGKAAMLVLADDDDDDGYVEIEGKSRRSRFVESARARCAACLTLASVLVASRSMALEEEVVDDAELAELGVLCEAADAAAPAVGHDDGDGDAGDDDTALPAPALPPTRSRRRSSWSASTAAVRPRPPPPSTTPLSCVAPSLRMTPLRPSLRASRRASRSLGTTRRRSRRRCPCC